MHKVEPTPPSEMRRYQMVTIGYDPFTLMSVCLPLGNRRSAAWCVDAAQLIAESVRRGGGVHSPHQGRGGVLSHRSRLGVSHVILVLTGPAKLRPTYAIYYS